MIEKKHVLALALALGVCLGAPVCQAKDQQPEATVATEAEVEAATREMVFQRAAELSQQASEAWKEFEAAAADKKSKKSELKRLKLEAQRLTAEARPWNAKRDEYLTAENADRRSLSDQKTEALLVSGKQTPLIYELGLDADNYQEYTLEADGRLVAFRAYENLVYVAQPADAAQQKMSIYIPAEYFQKQGKVNGYTGKLAPIFLPNGVSGHLPGQIMAPAVTEAGPNVSLRALAHGYVVAAPALRGRLSDTVDTEGHYVQESLAAVIDYKAAVRYLHHNQAALPAGNTEAIIAAGTGTGATLAAMLGTTGNHPDFEPYLLAMNAAPCRDDVAMAFCQGRLQEITDYARTAHPLPDYRAATHYLKLMEPLAYAEDGQARKAYIFVFSQLGQENSGTRERLAHKLEQAGVTVVSPIGSEEEFFDHLDGLLRDRKTLASILEKYTAHRNAEEPEAQAKSKDTETPVDADSVVRQELAENS